jgi:hypothetical protein
MTEDKWINPSPEKNSIKSVKKSSFMIIFFIFGLLVVSAVKNETRSLQKEINNLEASINDKKFDLSQAILDHEVLTSPENIAQLSQKYLEIDLLAYNLSQIHKLNHKDGEFLIKNKTQKESTTNNFKKNLPIIVKTEFTKKVKKTKTEIKKLHAIYSNPKLLPGEIKAKVAKEINIKRKELSDVYNSPKEVLSFEKAGKWGVVQVVKVFFGLPIIPGR